MFRVSNSALQAKETISKRKAEIEDLVSRPAVQKKYSWDLTLRYFNPILSLERKVNQQWLIQDRTRSWNVWGAGVSAGGPRNAVRAGTENSDYRVGLKFGVLFAGWTSSLGRRLLSFRLCLWRMLQESFVWCCEELLQEHYILSILETETRLDQHCESTGVFFRFVRSSSKKTGIFWSKTLKCCRGSLQTVSSCLLLILPSALRIHLRIGEFYWDERDAFDFLWSCRITQGRFDEVQRLEKDLAGAEALAFCTETPGTLFQDRLKVRQRAGKLRL